MSAVTLPASHRCVLADLLPGALTRDVALVVAGAAVTGAAAQVVLPLPGTPVPVTGQTFGALLTGATLGWRRGGASMLVYLLAGMAGVPWFTGTDAGWGSTGGYLVGYIFAAMLVGALASRGGDRTAMRTAATMAVGNLVIYAIGVPVLMMATGSNLATALADGMLPFLLGDALKILLATGLLPGTWMLVHRLHTRS